MMAKHLIKHQQTIFISVGGRVRYDNGLTIDRPIWERSVDLWAILPALFWLFAWFDLLAGLGRYISFQYNEAIIYIKTLLYWLNLIGGVLWQSGLTMPLLVR